MPIGGVRIEDDILITSKGYENLTTAPKGKAMFDIIRGKSSGSRTGKRSLAATTGASAPPLVRAPGVPHHITASPLPPLQRAATMPTSILQGKSRETGFRDHHMRSLNFRRSMTTDERVQHWRESSQRPPSPKFTPNPNSRSVSVCGALSPNVKHQYIGSDLDFPPQAQQLPNCTQCTLLVHALGRLRENLTRSDLRPWKDRQPLVSPSYSMPIRLPTSPTSLARATSPACGQRELESRNPGKRSTVQDDKSTQEQATTGMTELLQTNDTRPREYCERGIPQKTLNRISVHEPIMTLCPPAAHGQRPAEIAQTEATTERPSPHADVGQMVSQSRLGNPFSHATIPVRNRVPLDQAQRRSSAHTDDRDWMA